jgi:RHS repeat-associated protein
VEEAANTYQRVPYRYTSKELDEETGLYYYGARYYDPRTSVWQSVDPMLNKYLPIGNREHDQNLPGIDGVFNTRNLGLYTYSHNNPIVLLDPDGRAVFESAEELMKVGREIVEKPSLQPKNGVTWCNKGVGLIEERGGNTDYQGSVEGQFLLANQIVSKLQDPKYATTVTEQQAVEYAKQGVTVIAGAEGHVAIVAPKEMVASGMWKRKVPVLFNVGATNAIQGTNYSFNVADQPTYYVRNKDLKTLRQRNQEKSGAGVTQEKPSTGNNNIDMRGIMGDFPVGKVFENPLDDAT